MKAFIDKDFSFSFKYPSRFQHTPSENTATTTLGFTVAAPNMDNVIVTLVDYSHKKLAYADDTFDVIEKGGSVPPLMSKYSQKYETPFTVFEQPLLTGDGAACYHLAMRHVIKDVPFGETLEARVRGRYYRVYISCFNSCPLVHGYLSEWEALLRSLRLK
jgi:hypothetical protein